MRDKQIEEMAKIINKPCFEIMDEAGATDRDCPFPYSCEECAATNLYNAGYRKASDVARGIFEEIDTLIVRRMIPEIAWIDDRFITDIAKLKKKYLGEDINAPTKESEGEG